jgi:hypothetical protein
VEGANDERHAFRQGVARGGWLFLSCMLGMILGGLIGGEQGATVGCIVVPAILVLLWLC